MAKLVLKSFVTKLGGTDYSAQIASSTLTVEGPEVDVANFATSGFSETLVGILKGSLAIEFKKDADLSGLDAAVWAKLIHATDNKLAFIVRAQSAVIGVTNPEYRGDVNVNQWGIGGRVGEAFQGSVTWPTTGVITRATA